MFRDIKSEMSGLRRSKSLPSQVHPVQTLVRMMMESDFYGLVDRLSSEVTDTPLTYSDFAAELIPDDEKKLSEAVKWMANLRLFNKDAPPDMLDCIITMKSVLTLTLEPTHRFWSRFIHQFYIKNILGIGGFGVVFRTRRVGEDRDYAVKRIPIKPRKDIEILKNLKKPADLIKQVQHSPVNNFFIQMQIFPMYPQQIRPFDCEFLYIQMELCKSSLSELLKITLDHPLIRTVYRMRLWMKQITLAVEFMHDNNLIHRDLKPDNILLSAHDRAVLCDLGLATERRADAHAFERPSDDENLTFFANNETEGETHRSRTPIGTLLYMSPEQLSSWSEYSSKTDVFSLGLIFTEMILVLTADERRSIFDDFRIGKPYRFDHSEEIHTWIDNTVTTEFMEWLTQVDPQMRPTCREILAHAYFCERAILTEKDTISLLWKPQFPNEEWFYYTNLPDEYVVPEKPRAPKNLFPPLLFHFISSTLRSRAEACDPKNPITPATVKKNLKKLRRSSSLKNF